MAVAFALSRINDFAMQTGNLVEQIRQLVQQSLQELGIADAGELEETILIRNGFYCGRRFATSGAHAVWFAEENQLKIYGELGAVLRVIHQADQQAGQLPHRNALPLADAA